MIDGNLNLLLADPHVRRIAQRKGYDHVINALLAQHALCEQAGVLCVIRQKLTGINSWELTVPNGHYLLRYHRPLDGVIDLYHGFDRSAPVYQWTSAADVAGWFDAVRNARARVTA
jgi:hypothetical protein